MKIGLFLHKINTFTHTVGVWGESMWGNAMAKGFKQLQHQARTYGENMGYFPKEVDLAIYFHSDLPTFENPIGKTNIAIFHNWNNTISLEKRVEPYLNFKGKVATISKVLAQRYNWYFIIPCVDTEFFYPIEPDETYNYDLTFVGNAIKEPELMQKFFSFGKSKIKFVIFGNGFNKPLSHEESLKLYSSSLANFNFSMKECFSLDGIIGRPLQVAACRGLVISDKTPTLMDIFGDTMLYADNSIDIIKHIEWLKENEAKRLLMIERAYNIVVQNYNPKKSMGNILRWIYG